MVNVNLPVVNDSAQLLGVVSQPWTEGGARPARVEVGPSAVATGGRWSAGVLTGVSPIGDEDMSATAEGRDGDIAARATS